MNKKIIIGILMSMLMVGVVFATISNQEPDAETITDAETGTFDFYAESNLPFHVATPARDYIEMDFNSVISEIDCVYVPETHYVCDGAGFDISSVVDGIYPVTFKDQDGTTTPVNLIIDRVVVAGDFNFQATVYAVSYVKNCDCTPSGCDQEKAQYRFDGGEWTTMGESPQDFSSIEGAGNYEFQGYCKDIVGNEDHTSIDSYTLPASPPVLEGVYLMPDVASEDELCSETNPCDLLDIGGDGEPVDLSFKLTFDKDAALIITFDGADPSPETYPSDVHVISIYSLINGDHVLQIVASDGINSDTYIINFEVINAGDDGEVIIEIQEPTTPPQPPTITFTGQEPIVNSILPGDFAIVKYNLSMIGGNFTRFAFIGDEEFEEPVTMFCEEDYDEETEDIKEIQEYHSFEIDPLDGEIDPADESLAALNCPTTGTVEEGITYSVMAKYPISEEVDMGSSLSGSLTVALYKNDIYTECSDGIDNDEDGFIDLNDPGCANLDDDTELE